MRIGGTVFKEYDSPASWVKAVHAMGYTADRDFLPWDADDDLIRAYAEAARKADILVAELGAWHGWEQLHPDPGIRARHAEKIKTRLMQADKIGARCCVAISGYAVSCGEDEPLPDHLSKGIFDQVVETVREVIDAVRPTRTFFTLETMPWLYPNTVDSYVRLLKAVDRKAFAVHFDPINLLNSPERYYGNAVIVKEFCEKLGPHIRSCHVKDIVLTKRLMVHMDRTLPGQGGFDFRTFLCEVNKLGDPDLPLMLEYPGTEEEFRQSAAYLRSLAREEGIRL